MVRRAKWDEGRQQLDIDQCSNIRFNQGRVSDPKSELQDPIGQSSGGSATGHISH